MKTKILYLSFALSCSPVIVFSQTEEKSYAKAESLSTEVPKENQLFNNAKENSLKESDKKNPVLILKPVSLGTYTSPYILKSDYPWMRNYGISLSLFTSGSANNENSMLTEMIPYEINTGKPGEFRGSYITTYWDPGITVFSPNRKFSVDLYKKPSTQIFFNSPGKATPFLLNLHF